MRVVSVDFAESAADKVKTMDMNNTNDLSLFIDQLKNWAKKYSYESLVASIESAERTSFTASELILKYTELLRNWEPKIPANLPNEFKANWGKAIQVGDQALRTVEYEEKKRPIFSLG